VQPTTPVAVSGIRGGPFSPTSFQYQLSASAGTVNFQISGIPPWLNASFTRGTVTASQPLTVTFALRGAVNALAVGTYSNTITFTNTTNGLGNTSRTARLTVNAPPPTCTLHAIPATITRGDHAFISWKSANAVRGTIDNGVGAVGPSGVRAVTPAQTTTYTGEFVGSSGNTSCQATITVNLVPQTNGFARRNAIALDYAFDNPVFQSELSDLLAKLGGIAVYGPLGDVLVEISTKFRDAWDAAVEFNNGNYLSALNDALRILLEVFVDVFGSSVLAYPLDIAKIATAFTTAYLYGFTFGQ